MSNASIKNLMDEKDRILLRQRDLYVASVSNINSRYKELLGNNLGSEFVKNCARDTAGEVVRRYFDTSDYYITADQMLDRIIHFQYENGPDPLADQTESVRKAIYNMNDSKNFSSALKEISTTCQNAQKKLFEKTTTVSENGKTNKQYEDQSLIQKGKQQYRAEQTEKNGTPVDEISGAVAGSENLEVDHVQALSTARFNSRYLNTPEAIQGLKEFYNSSPNFEMLEKRANESKGDVRVFEHNGKSYSSTDVMNAKSRLESSLKAQYKEAGMSSADASAKAKSEAQSQIESQYVDITYKAGAAEVAKSVCDRWENTSGQTKEELIRTGKLDENGKVPKNVRNNLEKELRQSMNAESIYYLKMNDYSMVSRDALEQTKKGMTKIVIGQVIYYVLPPLVFETQGILKKKNITLDNFFQKFKKSGSRIINYVKSKLGYILRNILGNSLKKFIKSFFDIVIETVKETVKKLLRVAKDLALSLVQCVKVLADSHSNGTEKADAIVRILSGTITVAVLEVLFEYLERQFNLPDILMEPLQIIVTVLATNLIMLILNKADLFDVKYGLIVANIEKAFEEEFAAYKVESAYLMESHKATMTNALESIKRDIDNIHTKIADLDFYSESVEEPLNRINEVFNMGIDFETEWKSYISAV